LIHLYRAGLPRGEAFRVLVFVHGFNVTFPESVEEAARLAFGLRINILPVLVSWPSQGEMMKYFNDEQNIEASIERLRPVLQQLLSNREVDEVVMLAHSMGTRLVTRVLSELSLQKADVSKLSRVALAAADLNDKEFQELWPRIRTVPAKGWLFYTSANDYALRASAFLHAAAPIGDSQSRVFTLPEVDTVDASGIAPALRGYGHSYIIDNPLLQSDLRRWITQGLPASQRHLVKNSRAPGGFWELRN
jgi:esterase/lipase superfamily enzyme